MSTDLPGRQPSFAVVPRLTPTAAGSAAPAASGSATVGDAALTAVVRWFRAQPDMREKFAAAIRQAIDEVLDGQRTGRFDVEQLSKTDKTYIGSKVEIIVQHAFGLKRGEKLDYIVDGHEVDAKWSKSGQWMIPTEAVGELCLCISGDDRKATFEVGVVRATGDLLNRGSNKDKKRSLNKAGKDAITWLVQGGTLPENLLLRLPDDVRRKILDAGSGQQRVNELFRAVRGRLVRREVVLAVAQQDDGPKRVRDARRALDGEGIWILGHQGDDPRIARGLGLPVPSKGQWVSCKVKPVADDAASVEVGGRRWAPVGTDEPSLGDQPSGSSGPGRDIPGEPKDEQAGDAGHGA